VQEELENVVFAQVLTTLQPNIAKEEHIFVHHYQHRIYLLQFVVIKQQRFFSDMYLELLLKDFEVYLFLKL
jgi:hypothetical protein